MPKEVDVMATPPDRHNRSDARWRANMASCYETLRFVATDAPKTKRRVARTCILKETSAHIDFLENILTMLYRDKSRCTLSPDSNSINCLDDLKHQFARTHGNHVEYKKYSRQKNAQNQSPHISSLLQEVPDYYTPLAVKVEKEKKAPPAETITSPFISQTMISEKDSPYSTPDQSKDLKHLYGQIQPIESENTSPVNSDKSPNFMHNLYGQFTPMKLEKTFLFGTPDQSKISTQLPAERKASISSFCNAVKSKILVNASGQFPPIESENESPMKTLNQSKAFDYSTNQDVTMTEVRNGNITPVRKASKGGYLLSPRERQMSVYTNHPAFLTPSKCNKQRKASPQSWSSPTTPTFDLPKYRLFEGTNEQLVCTEDELDEDTPLSPGWTCQAGGERTPCKDIDIYASPNTDAVVPLGKRCLVLKRVVSTSRKVQRKPVKPSCCRQLEREYKMVDDFGSRGNVGKMMHPSDPTLYSPPTREEQKSLPHIWRGLQSQERETLYTLATLETVNENIVNEWKNSHCDDSDDAAIVPEMSADMVTSQTDSNDASSQLVPHMPLDDVGNDYHQVHSPIGLSQNDDGCFSDFLRDIHSPARITQA